MGPTRGQGRTRYRHGGGWGPSSPFPRGSAGDGNPLGETLFMGALFTAVGLAGFVWCGAATSSLVNRGGRIDASLSDALRAVFRLPGHLSDPAAAWPEATSAQLPGPLLYWTVHAAMAVALIGMALGAWRLFKGRREHDGLGVERSARFANRHDLRVLHVRGPKRGRIILGRVEGRLVATEERTGVCIIGPSQSGKTSGLCIPALLELRKGDGAVLAASVKGDLYAATHRRRSRLGEVKVFDPTHVVSRRSHTWSPLRGATTVTGAQAAARALMDVAGKSNLQDGDYWMTSSKELLWPLFFIARNTQATMRDVVRWVMTHDRPIVRSDGKTTKEGEVYERIRFLLDRARPDDPDITPPSGTPPIDITKPEPPPPFPTASEVALANDAISGTWQSGDRLRGSIYSSARNVLEAWSDPVVMTVSDSCEITPEWLFSGDNTLYIVAPANDQERFRALFTCLVGDLVHEAFRMATRRGGELERKLLALLDEAANICPVKQLPGWCSTAPSHGITLLTVWQDRSQQRMRYSREGAETIWNNSGAKVILSGLADEATAEVTQLLGEEEYQRPGVSFDAGSGRRSVNEQTQTRRLVTTDALRRQTRGQALLIYKELPPVRLQLRRPDNDARLQALQEGSGDGRWWSPVVGWRGADEARRVS